MTDRSIPEIEGLIAKLPIDDANYGVFQALLSLPYDLYRPIMDLLFDGAIFVEDLTDTAENAAAAAAQALDSGTAKELFAHDDFDVGSVALQARVQQILLTGGRATSVALARDQSAVGISQPGGLPAQTYVPGSMVDASYDSSLIAPNAIQTLRAGPGAPAQKAASAEFAAAMNKTIT